MCLNWISVGYLEFTAYTYRQKCHIRPFKINFDKLHSLCFGRRGQKVYSNCKNNVANKYTNKLYTCIALTQTKNSSFSFYASGEKLSNKMLQDKG